MKKLILFLTFITCSATAQTNKVINAKAQRIYKKYGKAHVIAATDSVVKVLQQDKWFLSLSPTDRKFRLLRIRKYEAICKANNKNTIYLKGWVTRALN